MFGARPVPIRRLPTADASASRRGRSSAWSSRSSWRPDIAGVLFTRNPIDGSDERVIEASWGLGEAVVDGRVIPDRYRVSRSGEVLERAPGVKKSPFAPGRMVALERRESRRTSCNGSVSMMRSWSNFTYWPSGARKYSPKRYLAREIAEGKDQTRGSTSAEAPPRQRHLQASARLGRSSPRDEPLDTGESSATSRRSLGSVATA